MRRRGLLLAFCDMAIRQRSKRSQEIEGDFQDPGAGSCRPGSVNGAINNAVSSLRFSLLIAWIDYESQHHCLALHGRAFLYALDAPFASPLTPQSPVKVGANPCSSRRRMSLLFSQPDVRIGLIRPELVLLLQTRPGMLEHLKALLGLCTADAPLEMTYRAEFLPCRISRISMLR
jgi:hypothetical protein